MKKRMVIKKPGIFALIFMTMAILAGCGNITGNPVEDAADQITDNTENNDNDSEEAVDEAKEKVKEFLDSVQEFAEDTGDSSEESEISDEEPDKDSESGQGDLTAEPTDIESGSEKTNSSDESAGLLTSTADINLRDIDGSGTNYEFTYGGETFSALYYTDNWRIIDSYKINNESDMLIICQALIDVNPVHGSDMVSYRTAGDMTYEWVQHNLIYELLPEGDDLKAHAKDVDLDPGDQNKSLDEIYEDRTGKEFNINDFIRN